MPHRRPLPELPDAADLERRIRDAVDRGDLDESYGLELVAARRRGEDLVLLARTLELLRDLGIDVLGPRYEHAMSPASP